MTTIVFLTFPLFFYRIYKNFSQRLMKDPTTWKSVVMKYEKITLCVRSEILWDFYTLIIDKTGIKSCILLFNDFKNFSLFNP